MTLVVLGGPPWGEPVCCSSLGFVALWGLFWWVHRSTLHYWDRLVRLRLFSLQRRRERYIIIYIWKIIHGLVPDVGLTYLPTNNNNAIKLKTPLIRGPRKTAKLLENSLLHHGARLFNTLPEDLRAAELPNAQPVTVTTFKARLDRFLWAVPDEPGPPKDDKVRQAETNSLLHQIYYRRDLPPQGARSSRRPRSKRLAGHAKVGR